MLVRQRGRNGLATFNGKAAALRTIIVRLAALNAFYVITAIKTVILI